MRTFPLTATDIVAPNIVLGLMRIGDKPSQRDEITLQTKTGIVGDGPYSDCSGHRDTASPSPARRRVIG